MSLTFLNPPPERGRPAGDRDAAHDHAHVTLRAIAGDPRVNRGRHVLRRHECIDLAREACDRLGLSYSEVDGRVKAVLAGNGS